RLGVDEDRPVCKARRHLCIVTGAAFMRRLKNALECSGTLLYALELLDERRALEVEQPRRLPFVPAGPLERSPNQLSFDVRDERIEVDAVVRQIDRRRQRWLLRLLNLDRKIADVDL